MILNEKRNRFVSSNLDLTRHWRNLPRSPLPKVRKHSRCNKIIYKIIIIKLNELADSGEKVKSVPNKLTNIVFKYPSAVLSYV